MWRQIRSQSLNLTSCTRIFILTFLKWPYLYLLQMRGAIARRGVLGRRRTWNEKSIFAASKQSCSAFVASEGESLGRISAQPTSTRGSPSSIVMCNKNTVVAWPWQLLAVMAS